MSTLATVKTLKQVNRLKMSPFNKNHHPRNTIRRKKEPAIWRCFTKWVSLKISQNSQKNTFSGVFFNTVAACKSFSLKRGLRQRCFPVNFAKLLGTPFYIIPPATASGPATASEMWKTMKRKQTKKNQQNLRICSLKC